MTDVETLLKQFIAEYESGAEADPRAYLDRAPQDADRQELGALIDAYLMRAPRRPWDREAYERSRAPQVVEALSQSLQGASGLWPSVLPRLRERARLKRSELVAELAARLGAQSKRTKVERYYHQMEQGLLPSPGVSDDVLEALGQIVGESREALRRAGQAFGQGPAGAVAEQRAFARTTGPMGAPPSPGPEPEAAEPAGEWDEVDRLFRGG